MNNAEVWMGSPWSRCSVMSSATAVSASSKRVFNDAASEDLHLALLELPRALADWPELDWDQGRLVCLRSCLMKPEHTDWVPRIVERLQRVAPGS